MTENWQKALGSHVFWITASVTVTPPGQPRTYQMKFTLHAEDKYNFNPDQSDIGTGTPDERNGQLVPAGLAHEYMNFATLSREVTWKEGNLKNTIIGEGSSRR